MKSIDRFICPIVSDEDGEMCIEFPDEFMDALDLKVGNVLVWEPGPDGTWIIKLFVEEEEDF